MILRIGLRGDALSHPMSHRATPTAPRPLQHGSLLVLYTVSGGSTLALETLWMRVISLWAGNTVVAAALVLVVFFVAAALGNLWGARLVERSPRPLIYYGRAEIAAGLAALITFAAGRWFWQHPGAFPAAWSGQIPATLLLVGPPAFLAGVAFPSLTETFVPSADRRTASAAPFYGLNLLGAALGVAAGGVLLPWKLGLKGSFTVAAGLQIAGGLIALRLATRTEAQPRRPAESGTAAGSAGLGWTLLAGSGALSLAVQSLLILWARQVLEGSVYAIAGVLTAFIGGLGLGALAAARLRAKGHAPADLLTLFAGSSALLLFIAPSAGAWLIQRRIDLTGATPVAMLAQALGGCALWLLPLTFCLGGVFPVAWELARSRTPHEGRVLGFALATNKFGAAFGALAGIFLLLPAFGLTRSTALLGWAYVLAAAVVVVQARRLNLRTTAILVAIAGVGVWQTSRPREVLGLTPALRVIADSTGPYGPVAVVEDRASGSRQILLNSRQRLSGTQRALASQHHQSWVPLLFCRRPERVMTIGMASGISAAAALDFPIRELHAVELVPEVVQAAHDHFAEWNRALFSDPRARVHLGDGRAVLARMPGKFDAIICDLFFPSEDGTANLYSREFFADARARLNPGGVFCLWLPCYQHTAQTAGSVVRTFSETFPSAVVVRANLDPTQPVIGLLGADDPIPISRNFLAAQLTSPAGRALATRSPFFRSPENAALLFAGDLHAADPDFVAFPPTTDDHPLLAYLGPRQPPARERLVGMTFLDWIGKRFVRPLYPSCDLGATSSDEVLAGVRAANLYFAAAVADSVIPGDTRPEAVRARQVQGYLERAQALQPAAALPRAALGQ
jgi:spermidine synthase